MKHLFTTLLLVALILAATTATADEAFRLHHYDAFTVLEVGPENILFIGNSITDMHDWGEAFGNPKILNRGVSGAVSDEVIENLEPMIAGKPAKVFLMIGTNDLGTSGINTAEHVATNTRTIIERITKESPETEIYVQGILPSALRDLDLQQEANDSLQVICSEYGLTYIDLWDELYGITSSSTYTYDYIHLTAYSYRIWCNAIAEYVGSDCVYPSSASNNNGGLSSTTGMRTTYFGMAPVTSSDILMIGDEMINAGEWKELLHNDNIKNRGTGWGYPGSAISTMTSQVPVILAGRDDNEEPAQIFLYAGVSEANTTSTDLEDVEEAYTELVETIRSYAPNAPLYLMSLLPTSTSSTNTDRVEPLNEWIEALADSTDNLYYVDCYTDMVSSGVANTTYFTGNYVYGLGYAKLSQILAPYIDGSTATTDEEAEALIALYEARATLGEAITTVLTIDVGDGVGQYPESALESLQTYVDSAYSLLASDNATTDEIEAYAETLTASLETIYSSIIPPTNSTDDNEYWYWLSTPLRDGRYVQSNGVGEGITGVTDPSYAPSMWKFVLRDDGDLDIINRDDGSYISPASSYNTQIYTSEEQPSAGWTLSYSGTMGYFIIASGTVQLNQTQSGLSYALYNWSSSSSLGCDRSDTGCQFLISDADDPAEEPEVEDPVLTLTDLEFDGSGPYRVPDDLAAPVLASNTMSVAIDFAQSASTSDNTLLTASSDEDGADYFGIIVRSSSRYGVQYIGDNDTEGWYTQSGTFGTTRVQMVITMDGDAETYYYYLGGSYDRSVSGMGSYGYRSFANVPSVSGLYIGGVVTGSDSNYCPFNGTIYSIRYWNSLLTESQVAVLSYDDLTPTGIIAISNEQLPISNCYYDLQGRPVSNPEKGVYIKDGHKILK